MQERKNKSIIFKIKREELEKIVVNSKSFSDIIRHIGLQIGSCNFRMLKTRLDIDKIDYSHIPTGINSNKNREFPTRATPLEEIMIEHSTYQTKHLKNRLLKEKILKNECSICGLNSLWENKKLVMILDHINGIRDDHRIDNLRLLCPNCNSQQITFCGKNKKKRYKYCIECGEEKSTKDGQYCLKCSSIKNGYNRRKIKNRPSIEQLQKEISESNYCAVGKKYGVTDRAIRKWLK